MLVNSLTSKCNHYSEFLKMLNEYYSLCLQTYRFVYSYVTLLNYNMSMYALYMFATARLGKLLRKSR